LFKKPAANDAEGGMVYRQVLAKRPENADFDIGTLLRVRKLDSCFVFN
jgi:hypothetical protein